MRLKIPKKKGGMFNDPRTSEEQQKVEQLVDYLNFFEFVATLERMRQINFNEVKKLFEYYLLRLKDFPEIVYYIEKNGFENLDVLIKKIR